MLIAVGSRSGKAGKTAIICSLLGALPGRWEAVKISGHLHGAAGPWVIEEERDRAGPHSTSRYLRAGAFRSWLLRAGTAGLAGALPALRQVLSEAGNALVESNRIVDSIRPDVFLFVETPARGPEAKAGVARYAALADAIIVAGAEAVEATADKPVFRAGPPGFTADALTEFVLGRIKQDPTG